MSGKFLTVWTFVGLFLIGGIVSIQQQQVPEPPLYALALHEGASTVPLDLPEAEKEAYLEELEQALDLGLGLLSTGASAVDVVAKVVAYLEDSPLFNAGKGAVLNRQGEVELDASIMEGRFLRCGAVAGTRTVKNPIYLARKIMEEGEHIFFSPEGAEDMADRWPLLRVDGKHFCTEERLAQWKRVQEIGFVGLDQAEDFHPMGTVGCVARDEKGNLAAATSTGGLVNKALGRIGDSATIGAGTYANNRSCAISCTGKGEEFIRQALASQVSTLVLMGDSSLQEASHEVVHHVLQPGDGGLVAIDRYGKISMPFNTSAMFRAAGDSDGLREIGIWPSSDPKDQEGPGQR